MQAFRHQKKILDNFQKGVRGIAVAPSLSKPIKGQEKALVQNLKKIISESIPKIGVKEVSTG